MTQIFSSESLPLSLQNMTEYDTPLSPTPCFVCAVSVPVTFLCSFPTQVYTGLTLTFVTGAPLLLVSDFWAPLACVCFGRLDWLHTAAALPTGRLTYLSSCTAFLIKVADQTCLLFVHKTEAHETGAISIRCNLYVQPLFPALCETWTQSTETVTDVLLAWALVNLSTKISAYKNFFYFVNSSAVSKSYTALTPK